MPRHTESGKVECGPVGHSGHSLAHRPQLANGEGRSLTVNILSESYFTVDVPHPCNYMNRLLRGRRRHRTQVRTTVSGPWTLDTGPGYDRRQYQRDVGPVRPG